MSLKIQLIIIVMDVLVILFLTNMVRNNKLDLKYALTWFLMLILVLILTIFPNIMETIANLVGISSPMNMLFFFGFCFSLLIIFVLTVALSRASQRISRLAQKVALLEHKLDQKDNLIQETGKEK